MKFFLTFKKLVYIFGSLLSKEEDRFSTRNLNDNQLQVGM
ncbi:uncharacterized protein METZ01_LOCUS274747 [marine metagenome]|uniref:Uncharacterized protein n=1 Tax=marine metagenome TaxID=408172 RepID=A0A382KEN1_9ZZZZ